MINLEIIESKDVENFSNSTRNKIGQTIPVEFRDQAAQKITQMVRGFSSIGISTMELKDLLVYFEEIGPTGKYVANSNL